MLDWGPNESKEIFVSLTETQVCNFRQAALKLGSSGSMHSIWHVVITAVIA